MNATETPIIGLKDVEVSSTSRTGSLLRSSKVYVVYDINLSALRGQTLGLVGESGCGKSTTASVMCGLVAPTARRVYFNGGEVTKRTAQARCRIGHAAPAVLQDSATAFNPHMIVCDQLADPMRVHKIGTEEERQKCVMEFISMVGLPSSALETLPGRFSGGQRQHVVIARALSLNPDTIITGEPTSVLDVSVRAQVFNLLTDLKRELNFAVVFTSHDVQTIRYISDRIAVTNKGLVVEKGSTRQLLESPKDPYTRTLFGVAPSLPHPTLEGK